MYALIDFERFWVLGIVEILKVNVIRLLEKLLCAFTKTQEEVLQICV